MSANLRCRREADDGLDFFAGWSPPPCTSIDLASTALEALGLLTGYTHKSSRRWKAATG